jgi:DNA-binding SARP family transcriptional activator
VLRARLFGALSAEVDGRSVPAVPGFKARSLFAYLLVHPGPHPRVRLAGLFWPDLPDTRARASLRVALFALRRTLEGVHGARYLVTDRISAGIAADLPRDIDVERFDELLAGGDPAALAEAAALHRGPLLSDLPDEWVLAAQDDYRLRVAGACERLGDHAEEAGDLAAAADWARRAVGFEPLRESGHRALISRLSEAGRPAEALAAYRKCTAVLSTELRVEAFPDAHTVSVETRRQLSAHVSAGARTVCGAGISKAVPSLVRVRLDGRAANRVGTLCVTDLRSSDDKTDPSPGAVRRRGIPAARSCSEFGFGLADQGG